MTDRELMQEYQARPHEILIAEIMDCRVPKNEREHAAAREIESLRERLSQPEREWVGLTDEDVRDAFNTAYNGEDYGIIGDFSWFAELIEAKLKEKNT